MTTPKSPFATTTKAIAGNYKDGTNLQVRHRFYEQFSTAPQPWPNWLFSQFEAPFNGSILDVGCGTGSLWVANADRIPLGWSITLLDISKGMLDDARRAVEKIDRNWKFQLGNTEILPFEDNSFDAVIANHMLYHVQDRQAAFHEFRRVLRPSGNVFAATTGAQHLNELRPITEEANVGRTGTGQSLFLLDNAEAQLREVFDYVDLRTHDDGLYVTDPEGLVDHIISSLPLELRDQDCVLRLREAVMKRLDGNGGMKITKQAGLFICR